MHQTQPDTTVDLQAAFDAAGVAVFAEVVEVIEPYPLHSHAHSELSIILAGQADHRIGDGVFGVSSGDVYVLLGQTRHCFLNPRDLVVGNVMFDAERMDIALDALRQLPGYRALFELEPQARQQHEFKSRLRLSPAALHLTRGLHRELVTELQLRDSGYRFVLRSLLTELLVYLARQYSRSQRPASRDLDRVSRVLTLLEEHPEREHSLDALAAVARMSPRSLLRVFREAVGCSPIDYLIQTRIERACRLLRSTGESVAEIASRVGVKSPEHFSRQFRQHMQCSPLHYRRQKPE